MAQHEAVKRATATSAIFLSMIVALEVVIMISPFAIFFYAVFNPFFLALNQSSITRWMTAFFLPHMVVPPNEVLATVRILGSVFFVAGVLVFFVYAIQVYLGKLLKKATATRGLYAVVRHPQYVGLALAAVGLAIMWPRFFTLVLLAVMLFLYYLLARDEERRMLNRYGEGYRAYMTRTGMFLPRITQKPLGKSSDLERRHGIGRAAAVLLVLLVVIVGGGILTRVYTVRHLPLEQIGSLDVITISPEDLTPARELLPDVIEDSLVASRLHSITADQNHRILAYFIPIDYVMQGMIANTGEDWKLFERHKTFGMITDYIFHPFGHLTGGHVHDATMQKHDVSMHNNPAMKRRIIFIQVSADSREILSPYDDLGINILRTPLFFVDVHLHTGEILQVHDTPAGSAWGTVPTPLF